MKMSKFEDYNSASNHYDEGRVPAGAKMYASIIQSYLDKPLAEINLLEAGCGTCNYSKAFLDNGIGKISCFDASEGMLEKAKKKLAGYIEDGRVGEMKQDFLPNIPFEDNSFDVIIFMQCLHHVDTPSSNYANLKGSMQSAMRVLKPGGVMLINYSSHEQVKYGSWYANLMPRSTEAYTTKYMQTDDLTGYLESIGFANVTSIVRPGDIILTPHQYYQKNGPLHDNWRRMDSLWTKAESENEVEEAKKFLQGMLDDGSFENWFERVEKKRKAIGITTSLFVQKPRS